MTFLSACFSTPAIFLFLGLSLGDGALRKALGPLSNLAFLIWLLGFNPEAPPLQRLFCCSLWLLYFIKGWSLLTIPRAELKTYSPAGLLLFSYLWPGVDPRPFQVRGTCDKQAVNWFAFGFPTMCVGIAAGGMLALHAESLPRSVLGLAGIAAILTTVHLGYSDILSSATRLLGFPVSRLFNQPLKCQNLRDFWSHRWNGPFVEMNKLLFQPLLAPLLSRRQTFLALFLLSGLLHELALSFPVSAIWGGPLLYFLIQALAMQTEKSLRISERWWSRLWTWTVLLLPAPLLFHSSFREVLVLPMFDYFHSLPTFSSWTGFFSSFLFLAGCGHFLVLCASFQVPHRLNWKEELQGLRPLNRKLLWTYGAYIASFILLWGIISINLIPEFLAGEKTALVLIAIIALFWWSRIFIDAFYFKHSDWPEGIEFVIGHTMLTSLFVTLACTYSGLLVWHLWPF